MITFTADDARDAGRLLAWGLDGRARPAQELEYGRLVERLLDDPAFRSLVAATAEGLGLRLLDASAHGLVLGPAEASPFTFRPADFRPTSSSADDRLLDGLVQLAIAATLFPRSRDLVEDPTFARPPVTLDDIEATLRSLSDRLAETHKDAPDPVADDGEGGGLYEAWRVYRSRLAAMETKDDRKGTRTTRRIIEYGLERLREFGCFTKSGAEGAEPSGQATWQATWRYQILVRELAATPAFEAFMAALPKA